MCITYFNPQWFISPGYSHYLWFVNFDSLVPMPYSIQFTIPCSITCDLAIIVVSSGNLIFLKILSPILNYSTSSNDFIIKYSLYSSNNVGRLLCNIPLWIISPSAYSRSPLDLGAVSLFVQSTNESMFPPINYNILKYFQPNEIMKHENFSSLTSRTLFGAIPIYPIPSKIMLVFWN